MKSSILKIGGVIIGLAVLPVLAFAQTATTPTPVPLSISNIQTLLENILTVLYVFFFIFAAIFIILAAYQYLTAGGSEEGVAKAKSMLVYAIIAIAVALVATGVKAAVESLLRGQGIPTP